MPKVRARCRSFCLFLSVAGLVLGRALPAQAQAEATLLVLSPSLLGAKASDVRRQFSSCDARGLSLLACRMNLLGQTADVEFRLGGTQQVSSFSVAVVGAMSEDRASQLYEQIGKRLQKQFPNLQEERYADFVRRTFLRPQQSAATATLVPHAAAPGQCTVEVTLLGPVAAR